MISQRDSIISKINEFSECFSNFSDDKMISYFRIFLKEFKTPFNKQKSIESLCGFFVNQENRQKILVSLKKIDFKILSFINYTLKPTEEDFFEFFKETEFFSDDNSHSISKTGKLHNLLDRLLILPKKTEDFSGRKEFFVINPILKEFLEPYLSEKFALDKTEVQDSFQEINFSLSVSFIASVISYVQDFPDLCKLDGEIKKKNQEKIEEIFQGNFSQFQLVFKSFINLGIFRQSESKISIDWEKLNSFAALKTFNQFVYIVASSCGHFSRNMLNIHLKMISDLLLSLFDFSLSEESLKQICFFSARSDDSDFSRNFTRRRFSMILESGGIYTESSEPKEEKSSGFVFDFAEIFIKNLNTLGLIFKNSHSPQKEFYSVNPILKNLNFPPVEKRKFVNIDSSFQVTVLPGLELSDFIKILPFLNILNSGIVVQFEIKKESVFNSFESGFSVKKIIDELEFYMNYSVPESFKINLEQWFDSYSGAKIYKGYVLKLDEKKDILWKNNPNFLKFTQEIIAPGLYFLNIPVEDENSDILKILGIKEAGLVQAVKKETQFPGFKEISCGENIFVRHKPVLEEPWEYFKFERENLVKTLQDSVSECEFTTEEKSELSSRILNGIIINSSQIKNGSVRIEVYEAGGMDYSGKIHLINTAISSKSMLEISVPCDDGSGKIQTFFGLPQLLTKAEDSAVVRITTEPEKEERVFSVGRIILIKMKKTIQ